MKKQNVTKTKRVFNLIIVDESSSMSIIRKQAFTGMNETLHTVRQMQRLHPHTEQRVTLITFSSSDTKWHYDNTPAKYTKDLHWRSYSPNSCTPLYDAIGNAISKVNAQTEEGDNVLVTIITDGEENSSREWTLELINKMIKKLKKQNWTFTLIGTDNLDVESMANSFAIDEHMKFKQDEEGTKAMFLHERRCRKRFNELVETDTTLEKGAFFEDN